MVLEYHRYLNTANYAKPLITGIRLSLLRNGIVEIEGCLRGQKLRSWEQNRHVISDGNPVFVLQAFEPL